jgi:hypothetical protein
MGPFRTKITPQDSTQFAPVVETWLRLAHLFAPSVPRSIPVAIIRQRPDPQVPRLLVPIGFLGRSASSAVRFMLHLIPAVTASIAR